MLAKNVQAGPLPAQAVGSGDAAVTNYNIDVVRSYLTQWVIVAHVAMPLFGIPLIPGRFAVWGFFLVSGYLNSLSFQRSLGSASFRTSIARYYRSRARRIYPMLIFSYAVVSLVSGGLLNPDLKVLIPLAYFYNFELLNGVLWTLAIELQFYVLTPFLVTWLLRLGPRGNVSVFYLLCACAALIYVVPMLHVILMEDSGYLDDRTTLGNLGFYLFGIVLALGRDEALALWKRIARWAMPALAIYAVTFLWLFNAVGPGWKLMLFGQPLVLLAGLAVLCAGVKFHPAWATMFHFLGYYTYEIYIFHGLGGLALSRLDIPNNLPTQLLFVWMLPVVAAGTLHLFRRFSVTGGCTGNRQY